MRIAASSPSARFLCAGALDVERHPGWVRRGEARSWLHVYERALS